MPSAAEVQARRIVGVNEETVTNVSSTDFPGHYTGEDHAWDLKKFAKNLKIQMHYNNPLDCSFSLIGVDASIANAFRRILLAEIPTLAIEYVFIHNNTSNIHDEILAQRLGLIPLKGNQDGIRSLRWYKKATDEDPTEAEPHDFNTIVMKMDIACTENPNADPKETDTTKRYLNSNVYASDLKFEVQGRQRNWFIGPENEIRAANPNILLAKLVPGQTINLECHCIIGIGSDHAKFSPVATATYRLLPVIDIISPIVGKDADKFARCFPRGVIGFDEVTRSEAKQQGTAATGKQGEKKAVVLNPMLDTVSRECLRHEEFNGKVKLGRVRDHFIFSIESTGQFDSDEMFIEAVKVLRMKAERLKKALSALSKESV